MDILEEIRKLEKEQKIKIIFASEHGARCWGLQSPTSDYDVRFIFHHPVKEYLKISRPSDTLDVKMDDIGIDFMGYDVYKYLDLIAKSNINMLEMLNSHIVYYDDGSELMKAIRECADTCFSSVVGFYHYHAMGWNNFNKYVLRSKDKGKSLAKAYVYALRGLLGALYVYEHWELLPADFENVLRKSEVVPEEVKAVYFEKFIPMKRGEIEEELERVQIVDEFLEAEFTSRKELHAEAKKRRIKGKPIPESINAILVDTLINSMETL